MTTFHACRRIAVTGLLTTGSLQAAVTAGTSSAVGLDANVSVLGVITSTPVQIGFDTANSPGPYNDSPSAIAVNANVGGGLSPIGSITTLAAQGLLATNVQSNVEGNPGSRFALGSATLTGPAGAGPFTATIADVDLIITNPPSLITLSATSIETMATISGDYGSFTATGTAVLADFALSANGGASVGLSGLSQIGGGSLTAGIHFNATTGEILVPNLQIDLAALGILNATLILNRQVTTIDTAGQRDLEVTAIALDVNSTVNTVPGVSVDLDLAKSSAQLTAVPEPELPAMLAGSMALLFLGRRRRD
jgi:hypothetical protein